MNLRTWGADAFTREAFGDAELAAVQTALDRIADGEEDAPPVDCGMRQVLARA